MAPKRKSKDQPKSKDQSETQKPKRGRGRPRKEINVKLLQGLAKVGCTMPEMAILLEVSEDTLHRNFAGIIKRGWKELDSSLRRVQVESALRGNPTMQIWLGKQRLGQRNEPAPESQVDNLHEFTQALRTRYAQIQREKGQK